MPYVFSEVQTRQLTPVDLCVEDLRNSPVRGRDTKFRLVQQSMLAYTFDSFIPGFSSSHVYNTKPFADLVRQPLLNADSEGALRFQADYGVKDNAKAKVAGDIFESLLTAVMWNAVARWNAYMRGAGWSTSPHYPRPRTVPDVAKQFAIVNLPRGYDWVRLLTTSATLRIEAIRSDLSSNYGLALPTSTPDIALIRLPDGQRLEPIWATEDQHLDRSTQAEHASAYALLQGLVEPEDIVLAIAAKRSLRSDRLYQPLYEANLMQLILEGFLGAPRVEFEVHTLDFQGTAAVGTYQAASLYGVALQYQAALQAGGAGGTPSGAVPGNNAHMHRAVRELYIPKHAKELAERILTFMDGL